MYRVIVADDEIASLEHICMILERKFPEFVVVEQAENGEEALQKIRRLPPDLLISDVKMPLINGIELVKRVKEEYPDVLSLIVSGYQDFEYAKGAIQSGVCDYILKPVTPDNMRSVLGSIRKRLEARVLEKRNQCIRMLAGGEEPDRDMIKLWADGGRYYTALIRRNGLPGRLGSRPGTETFSSENEQVIIYGRDEHEQLYLYPEELLLNDSFEEVMRRVKQKMETEQGYLTLLLHEQPCQPDELRGRIAKLYHGLVNQTVTGRSQVLLYDEQGGWKGGVADTKNPPEDYLSRICYVVKEQQFHKLGREMELLLKKLGEHKYSQLKMEAAVRQVLAGLEAYMPAISDQGMELIVEDLFYYAESLEDLIENLQDMFERELIKEGQVTGRQDSLSYFHRILEYMHEHKSEALSLKEVCRKFGISQPSLSRMFKKHTDKSFNTYLTSLRISYAKEIIRTDPQVYVKDVAAMAGYSDQFYFSRIFKSVTGQTPSEYMEQLIQ